MSLGMDIRRVLRKFIRQPVYSNIRKFVQNREPQLAVFAEEAATICKLRQLNSYNNNLFIIICFGFLLILMYCADVKQSV